MSVTKIIAFSTVFTFGASLVAIFRFALAVDEFGGEEIGSIAWQGGVMLLLLAMFVVSAMVTLACALRDRGSP